jgi:long-subunit acyl-CoA synthetase (AMP-forming)
MVENEQVLEKSSVLRNLGMTVKKNQFAVCIITSNNQEYLVLIFVIFSAELRILPVMNK